MYNYVQVRSLEPQENKVTSFENPRYGAWNQKKAFKPPEHPKTPEQEIRLREVLGNSFLFGNCDDESKGVLIRAMEEVRTSQGQTVIRQGDDGDFLFAIESGSLECWKTFEPGSDPVMVRMLWKGCEPGSDLVMVKKVSAGDVFGELALLYNVPRAASVRVWEDAILWKLDRETFNAVVKDASAAKRDKYDKILEKVPLFQGIQVYERSQIGDALREETFKKGDAIITQGDEGDRFYILVEGQCHAEVNGNNVLAYKHGDYFGELAILYNQPRAASIIADSACKVIYLTRSSFTKMLGPLVKILTRDSDKYQQ